MGDGQERDGVSGMDRRRAGINIGRRSLGASNAAFRKEGRDSGVGGDMFGAEGQQTDGEVGTRCRIRTRRQTMFLTSTRGDLHVRGRGSRR